MIPPVYPKYFDGVMAEKNYSVNLEDIFETCVNCGCRTGEYKKVSTQFGFPIRKRIIFNFLTGSFHSTPETGYSKPRYSKILDIVNKTQLPSWDFIDTFCLDIVNDSI